MNAEAGPSSRINALARPTASRLRASLVIPSLPTVLSELAHNALDARATRIEAWVSLQPGEESMRLEDDGEGIPAFDMVYIGEPHVSSKDTAESGMAGTEYGFRGEALAAISALALVEITSRVHGAPACAKVIKNRNTIFLGPRDLGRGQGTTVAVRDLFNSVPVRAAGIAGRATLASCRREIETLALVHPSVRWTLWEERVGGARKVVSLSGARNSLAAFKALYGSAGVERTQSVHVSAGARRVDGFISLEGAVTKAHQHLYVNGYPLESSDLQQVISRQFAASRFSSMASDLTDDIEGPTKRPSPRRLERHPVYVLDITLPPDEVDAAYEPRKTTLGYKDAGKVRSFLVAVVDDFLRRQGFGPRATTASPTPSPSKRRGSPLRPRAEKAPRLQKAIPLRARSPLSAPVTPTRVALGSVANVLDGDSGPDGDHPASPVPVPLVEDPPSPLHTNPNWIHDIMEKLDTGVLPIRSRELRPVPDLPSLDVTFPISTLASARVLGQVDRKFVACVLPADAKRVLVVFDQHAADERAAVEGILDALCDGFAGDMPTRELEEGDLGVVLTRAEGEMLELPGVRDILRRWGIELAPPTLPEGDYLQISVTRVPSLLERLAKKAEMTRLLKLYLPILAADMGEIQALLASDPGGARVQRWMAPEMVELANSKACRGAIMFEDRLDVEQCTRLIARLAATRNPWICAHGRPTFAPLRVLDARPARKQPIDWQKWKSRG